MKNLNSFFSKDVKFSLNEKVIIDCAEVKGVIKEISFSSNEEAWYRVIYPYGSIWVEYEENGNCGDKNRDNAWVRESGLRKNSVKESLYEKAFKLIECQLINWKV